MFRADGSLPVGEHLATWLEVEARFGTAGVRRPVLISGLGAALSNLQGAGCTTAWIDGSFVTDKPEPNDFDFCWDETGVDLARLDPVFLDFSNARAAQKARYGGEMFPANASADSLGTPYRSFFQQKFGAPKGIIRIDL